MARKDWREMQRKLQVPQCTERTGQEASTYRYSRIVRASLYRWKRAYE
jgi:hypothetical protein